MSNPKGGKKAKKMANHVHVEKESTVTLADEYHKYAIINKVFGGGTYEVTLLDSKEKIRALKRGKHEKGKARTMFEIGDYILVSMRDYQKNVCDIELKYNHKQVEELRSKCEIPSEEKDIDDSIIFEITDEIFDNI